MAISSGVGPHAAWLSVNGQQWPLEHGSANLSATKKSGSFAGVIPMSWPGANAALSQLEGGNTAQIIVTTRGMPATLMTGEVDEVEFDYIGRAIRIKGRDMSARLHEVTSSEKWLNKKPSEIVQDLIGRVGLTGNITTGQLQAGKQLQQDFVKLSHIVPYSGVIDEVAQFEGMKWYFDANGVFHYVPMDAALGTYSITINQDNEPISADCLELDVSHNLQAGKTISATVASWHPKAKKVFSYTSNVEGRGGTKTYRYNIPTLHTDHAARHARSQSQEKARHEFTVTATVVGDPSVQAGMGLQLNGTPFDQSFSIDTVHHDFGMQGHLTHITARSAKAGRSAS